MGIRLRQCETTITYRRILARAVAATSFVAICGGKRRRLHSTRTPGSDCNGEADSSWRKRKVSKGFESWYVLLHLWLCSLNLKFSRRRIREYKGAILAVECRGIGMSLSFFIGKVDFHTRCFGFELCDDRIIGKFRNWISFYEYGDDSPWAIADLRGRLSTVRCNAINATS